MKEILVSLILVVAVLYYIGVILGLVIQRHSFRYNWFLAHHRYNIDRGKFRAGMKITVESLKAGPERYKLPQEFTKGLSYQERNTYLIYRHDNTMLQLLGNVTSIFQHIILGLLWFILISVMILIVVLGEFISEIKKSSMTSERAKALDIIGRLLGVELIYSGIQLYADKKYVDITLELYHNLKIKNRLRREFEKNVTEATLLYPLFNSELV